MVTSRGKSLLFGKTAPRSKIAKREPGEPRLLTFLARVLCTFAEVCGSSLTKDMGACRLVSGGTGHREHLETSCLDSPTVSGVAPTVFLLVRTGRGRARGETLQRNETERGLWAFYSIVVIALTAVVFFDRCRACAERLSCRLGCQKSAQCRLRATL